MRKTTKVKQTTKSAAKATTGAIIVTAIGKVLGFVRNAMLAALFGATSQTDAFYMAINIHTMFTDLAGTGITANIVPMRTQAISEDGKQRADQFTSTLLYLLLLLTSVVAIISFFAAPSIVKFIASDFTEPQKALTANMLRIFAPLMLVSGICLFLSSVLNAHHKYIQVHLAAIPLSLGWLIMPLLFHREWGIYAMTAGYVVGMVAQLFVLLPSLRGVYRIRRGITLKSDLVKKTLRMSMPVLGATVLGIVSSAVEKNLASGLEPGSLSGLSYAHQLASLLTNILIIPLTTTLLTVLSQRVTNKDHTGFKRDFLRMGSMLIVLLVPIVLIFVVCNEDIVRFVYQRGSFDEAAVGLTRQAFMFASLSLFFTGFKMMGNQCVYAIKKPSYALLAMCIGLMVQVVMDIILVKRLQAGGLALGAGISHAVMAMVYILLIRKQTGAIGMAKWVRDLGKVVLAAVPLAVSLILCSMYLPLHYVLNAMIGASIGGILYIVSLYIQKQEEVRGACEWLLKKLHHQSP